jgi:branched-chain amino acid transport system ATP-binding protein
MLSVQNLEASYGASRVLFDINLDVTEGECVTLLGRNGMGKTTTIKCIMGLLGPRAGDLSFDRQSIRGRSPERIARLGLGLVPEGRQIFPTLTVRENLMATSANRLKRARPWTEARVCELFPRLGERRDQWASTLSGGEQQMLSIGRALMTNPRLLILDEATEGLAPVIRAEIWQCVEELRRAGQSILIVDKNISVLRRLADRHVVIEKGRTVWRGSSADMARDWARVHGWLGV